MNRSDTTTSIRLSAHIMPTRNDLSIYVIYDKPADYPGKYVVRRWLVDQPTEDVQTADTLEEARNLVPEGLVRLNRMKQDDPAITEIWL